jgi:hypothetical protein
MRRPLRILLQASSHSRPSSGGRPLSRWWCRAQLTVARQAGPSRVLALQCTLSSATVPFLAVIRAASDAPTSGTGILLLLYFGLAFLQGQLVWPAKLLWKNVRRVVVSLRGISSHWTTFVKGPEVAFVVLSNRRCPEPFGPWRLRVPMVPPVTASAAILSCAMDARVRESHAGLIRQIGSIIDGGLLA